MAAPEDHSVIQPASSNGTLAASTGVTLPQRRPSVTLHRRVSLSEGNSSTGRNSGLARRDSLEGTKQFYNVGPISPPIQSSSSRLSFRSLARQDADPTSSDAISLPTSPVRMAAPLPTPRAFLTPKKPTAAIRLEQKLNKNRQSTQIPSDVGSDKNEGRLTYRSDESAFSPEPVSLDAMINDNTHLEDRYMQPSRTDVSMTDVSTPPRNVRELSSDNLMNTLPSEKTLGGTPVGTPKHTRKYKVFENKQTTWLLGGRVMTGGDTPWSVLMTVTAILGLTGIWLGTTGAWIWQDGTEYGLAKGGGIAIVIVLIYMFGLVCSSFVAAALRDPGIIPRNLDPEPPMSQVESWWEADNREMAVKDGKVVVKYCETCKTYRPPRCSHCRLCGNCVDGIDHHCSYIHTCVGKRNYLAFLTLLVSATISAIYIVVFSALHFSLLCHHDHISFKSALQDSPGAAVSFLLGVLMLPFILFLLGYHVRLLMFNLTTVEQIRASASTSLWRATKRPNNLFAEDSLASNILIASLGRPQFPSWVDAKGWQVEDCRTVNPALTDPKWATETA